MSFDVSKEDINESHIGIIVHNVNNPIFLSNMKTLQDLRHFMNNKCELIMKDLEFFDFCALPNNYLLTVGDGEHSLSIYDSDFNFVKGTNRINGRKISPYSVACNEENALYVVDGIKNEILMMDLNFNLIKLTSQYNSQKFVALGGLCYKNNALFICDRSNKKILKFNAKLEPSASYIIDFTPYRISVSNRVACVMSFMPAEQCVCFYGLNDFKLKYKYFAHSGRINEINSIFYEISRREHIICYNSDGVLMQKIFIKEIQDYFQGGEDGCIIAFNKYFLVSCYNSKKLFKIQI